MSVSLFDAVTRTCYVVYQFTDDPSCVLQVGLSRARATISFSDGTRIERGELVGTLYFWIEHLPPYTSDGPDLGGPTWCAGRCSTATDIPSRSPRIVDFPRLAARALCWPPEVNRERSLYRVTAASADDLAGDQRTE